MFGKLVFRVAPQSHLVVPLRAWLIHRWPVFMRSELTGVEFERVCRDAEGLIVSHFLLGLQPCRLFV